MADEFVLVVDGALADADIDAAVAEIVEQRELHGEPHRMMERRLHHGEADADLLVFIASAAANISESL